ncbi:glycosyl hydrolase family 28-related protein [Pseudoalteromonas byunsanensis]|uniref:Rhamnogalacturonase A/B/Epimerase-like pectate lyase domain-containing protein n=1 Tax=Pseudoalteromonas byunsanensis TaxID=327939 RepID=A0A1S1N247_9GAMM|nr:glycosyl hydrolase family 28-related protein [Pseudoalteromonas byunsanensis]OHU93385.1 hypothetical protein BIW53_18660 [Pseudoalteromonas byunsanensis]
MKGYSTLFLLGTMTVASTSAFAVDTSTVSITDTRFGAVANDNIDDAQAIQAAINYAITNNKSLYIPAGTFNVESTLDFTQVSGSHRSKLKVTGEKRELSKLVTSSNISLLKVAHGVEVHNLTLTQNNAQPMGKAIDIPFASYRSHFSKLDIAGFDKGIYGKWVIWSRFEDLFIMNVNSGIELHGNGTDPAYWNTEPNGWFNNVNVFDNVYVEGAQTGLKLAAMGSNIVNSTVQNSNVGVEIYGPADHYTWNNQISNFYAEGVNTVFKVKNSRSLDINGVFAQGGSSSNRKYAVIDAQNGGTITLNGMTGQDWWQHSAVLKNTQLIGKVVAIGGTGNYDDNSTHTDGITKQSAVISLPANRTWHPLPSKMAIQGNSSYRVTISGIRDGYEPVLEEYAIYNFNGSSKLGKVSHISGRQRIKFKIESGQIYAQLDYVGGGGLSAGKITLEKVH